MRKFLTRALSALAVLLVLLTLGGLAANFWIRFRIDELTREPVEGNSFLIERAVPYGPDHPSPFHSADLFTPTGPGPHPVLIVIHGGGWRFGSPHHMEHIARAAADKGYFVISVRYRLAPPHPFPAQYEDCLSALSWLRENRETRDLDLERVAAWGYSAGAQLAALLAFANPADILGPQASPAPFRIRAAVLGGTPADLESIPADSPFLSAFLDGSRAENPSAYRRASPLTHVTSDDAPVYLYHGQSDWIVPIPNGRHLHQRCLLNGIPVTLRELPDLDHFEALFAPRALREGFAFLRDQLALPAPEPVTRTRFPNP